MLKFGAPLEHFTLPLWYFIKNEKKSHGEKVIFIVKFIVLHQSSKVMGYLKQGVSPKRSKVIVFTPKL